MLYSAEWDERSWSWAGWVRTREFLICEMNLKPCLHRQPETVSSRPDDKKAACPSYKYLLLPYNVYSELTGEWYFLFKGQHKLHVLRNLDTVSSPRTVTPLYRKRPIAVLLCLYCWRTAHALEWRTLANRQALPGTQPNNVKWQTQPRTVQRTISQQTSRIPIHTHAHALFLVCTALSPWRW
jgi:hypothetical protein